MRLESTRKSDLAVRAMIGLADVESRLKAADLAELLGTTSSFMSHVMTPLVKHGWVASDPGRNGGYRLLAGLRDVSVLELVEAVEGPLETGQCVAADRPCDDYAACAMHHAWTKARTTLALELAGTSIADVAKSNSDQRRRTPPGRSRTEITES